MKTIKLTEEEVDDIRQGLIIAMKKLDEHSNGKGSDHILADRIEKIMEEKLNNL